ncbi:radical SAM/SPASM domain-containing protein [Akkermansia muciniphila]
MNTQFKEKQFFPSTKVLPPPYHTLEHDGICFVYDTSNCVLFRVDHLTKEFLDFCLKYPFEEAKKRFLRKNVSDLEVCENIFNEVEIMAQHGLFTQPDYTLTPEKFQHLLDERYSRAWNKLELALSESCNLACKYCYCATSRDMPSKGLMTEQVARMAITWLFAFSGKSEQVSITFFGGEPLLNKPVIRFSLEYSQHLAKLHGKKVFYSMTTNGTLLDDEIIGYIKKYNFGLMVSLDGPQKLHDKQCPTQGGKGSYEMAVKGIKRLMARRRAVTVRGTMVHPLPNMMELIKFYEDFGFTRIVLGKAINSVNASPVDCDNSDFEEYFKQEDKVLIPWILNKLENGENPKYYPYNNIVRDLENGGFSPNVSPFHCGACRGTSTVGADGKLYPCHRFGGMKEWQIGDIFDGPDYNKCKEFWKKYYEIVSQKCASCWLWSICKGPCPWEIANADGTFRDPVFCDRMEQFVKKAFYVYYKKSLFSK